MEKYINSSKNQREVEKNKVYLNTPEQTKNTIKNKIKILKSSDYEENNIILTISM